MDSLSSGLGLADVALFLNRLVLGSFFFLARFRFIYDPSKSAGHWQLEPIPEGHRVLISARRGDKYWTWVKSSRWFNRDRRQSLMNKICHCGHGRWWAWPVAAAEIGGGLMLILGIFAPAAAAILLVLTIVASRCTAKTKVYEQNPVDRIDVCACYLWRVEGLYIIMAAVTVLGGPGIWSIT